MTFLLCKQLKFVKHFVQPESFCFGKGVEGNVSVYCRDELDLLFAKLRDSVTGFLAFFLSLFEDRVYFGYVGLRFGDGFVNDFGFLANFLPAAVGISAFFFVTICLMRPFS